HITTGRKLAGGLAADAASVVVMLDGKTSFRSPSARNAYIYWGAYLGMPDETLIAGKVEDVAERIAAVREEMRARKGWIMDVYLLKPRKAPT
ncbi:MAG: precorrin-6A synthase (deacetylating), partial [Microvirga sp.]